MLKRILIGLSVFLLLLLAAILILPGLVPTDSYRDRLEADLSRVFARDVQITGDIDISTFPILKVETGSISLANPQGFPEGQFVDVQSMSAKIRLWPLLRKRVEISGVTLQSPSIQLEKQADGRVNWVSQEPQEPVETGPYKRDGRFTEYDPSLALLRIENGTLQYVDASSGQSFEADSINLDLRAPGLDRKLQLNGDLVFDGLNTAIDAELSSPADFLNGLETDFAATISTPEGELSATGRFLESEDLTFIADFNASSEEPNSLSARFPLPEDLSVPTLSSVSASGQISFQPDTIAFPAVTANAKGGAIEASFDGELNLTEGSRSSGVFSVKLDDMAVIEPFLDEPVEAMKVVSSFDAEGNLVWVGSNFTLSNITAAVRGSGLAANFTGNAAYASSLSLDGKFDGSSENLAKLIKTAGLSQPDAAALKQVTASGEVTLRDGETTLSNLIAEASEGFLNGKYTGEISFAETLALNGQLVGEISDLAALDQAIPREIPYSNVVKRIAISSNIQSASDSYTLSKLSAALKDGLLNGDFNGRLTLGNQSDISGGLSVTAESLRAIANSQNIILPRSTETGPIFENFSISGQVSGSPERLIFRSGKIKLDDISGAGDFIVTLASTKPVLNGTLSLSPLDLRPYMAAWSEQNPEGKILPWSEDEIILSGLNATDATVDMSTPSIVMDRLELGPSQGVISLESGILTADLTNTKLYGGDASGVFSIASENSIPKVSVKATVKSVAAQSFLQATGGFDKISGTSDLSLSFTGQGKSQADIMKNLSGDGTFQVLNGQLIGLDAEALLSGIDTALAQRQLPAGIGLGKTTQFKDIDGAFSLENGQANLNRFQLQAGDFVVEADGLIDIGQQSIDIGLHPKLSSRSNLAQFGIPLRFTGGFGLAKPTLDTSFLGEIAEAKAGQKASDTVRDNLGGPLGNILGGVIGGQNPTREPPQDSEIVEGEVSTDDVAAEPDAETTAPEAEKDETPEEQIGNALKDLFGRKKKD